MAPPTTRDRPPLDESALRELALRYVARFATSEAKLRRYLERKLFERGWVGDGPAPVAAVIARLAGLGYVDDRAFAEARARDLGHRGLGARRIAADLQAAGIIRDLAAEIATTGDALAVAVAYARRRRFGPFDPRPPDRDRRRRQEAAMLRAGHGFGEIRTVLDGAFDVDD